MQSVIRHVRLSRKSAPSAARPANRKLSRPRIVPGGARSKLTPGRLRRIMYTRGRQWRTRGDSSRYSLLMGVLFSGAPGSPGTCHASLGSRATLLLTPPDVKESPEVREPRSFRMPYVSFVSEVFSLSVVCT